MNSALTQERQVCPVHVAIVMDGNGRWAEERRKPRLFGHKAGVKSVRTVVETAREIGVRHLTLYAFSTENWSRPKLEVKGLMRLLDNYLESEQQNMLENDIRLNCIGQKKSLPDHVTQTMDRVIDATAKCSSMTLNLALSYGSRNEIIRAIRSIAAKYSDGRISIDDINEQTVDDHLDTAGQPDPDLLIRTGGEKRLSNFLLWQASYAELYFTDTKWPDFGRDAFLEAISAFSNRQRRFGKTGSQMIKE